MFVYKYNLIDISLINNYLHHSNFQDNHHGTFVVMVIYDEFVPYQQDSEHNWGDLCGLIMAQYMIEFDDLEQLEIGFEASLDRSWFLHTHLRTHNKNSTLQI